MPGWYIHMGVARKTIARLAENKIAGAIFGQNGPDAATIANLARTNSAYLTLGAIGPDLFFLPPDFKPLIGGMLWKLASFIRELNTTLDDNLLDPYESAMGRIANNAADEINALTGRLKDSLEGIFDQANPLRRLHLSFGRRRHEVVE